MKKLLSLILTICMCLGLVFALSSCDTGAIHVHDAADTLAYNEDFHWYPCTSDACSVKILEAEHELVDNESGEGQICKKCGYTTAPAPDLEPHDHSFSDEYSSNDNYHWFACTTEGCTERAEREEHAYLTPEITQDATAITRTYTCEICAHVRTERTEISSVVDGEASWNQAFENLEFLNYSMKVTITYPTYTQINECEITENVVHYYIPGSVEFYSERLEDGTCATYVCVDDEDGYFVKLPDTSDASLVGAQTETLLRISFAEHFDKFSYDQQTGEYTYAGEIEVAAMDFNGNPLGTIICFNNVVKVADGKVTYISADYKEGTLVDGGSDGDLIEADSYSFVYYNIGITEVVIPDSVVNGTPDLGDPDVNMPGGDAGDGVPDGPTDDGASGGEEGGNNNNDDHNDNLTDDGGVNTPITPIE